MAGRREELDNKEDLLLVPSRQGYRGYRRGLITQQLTQMEEALLVCGICDGLLNNACNYGNGQGTCCESCLGAGEVAQGIGAIRTMVSNLRCQCPLGVKGCEWEGTIQGLWGHLDTCGCFVVLCPYGKYGCDVSLRRGQLETHRREGKEYHTELVMVHLGNKVEEQSVTIERLERLIGQLMEEREYYKKNEVTWKITQVESIQDAMKQHKQQDKQQSKQQQRQNSPFHQPQRGFPQNVYPMYCPPQLQQLQQQQLQQQQPLQQPQQQQGMFVDPTTQSLMLNGPTFQLDTNSLTLRLEVKETRVLSFCLFIQNANNNMSGMLLFGQQPQVPQAPQNPCCQLKFKLTISNKINSGDDWVREIGPLDLKSSTQSLLLADINPMLLFSEEFSCDETILLQLLYSVTNT